MPRLDVFNEESDFEILAECLNQNGDALTPGTAKYHIYDETNDQNVRDWTALSIGGNVLTVPIDADDLEIIDDSNSYEIRILTVYITYGFEDSKEFYEEYKFKVKNLKKAPYSA